MKSGEGGEEGGGKGVQNFSTNNNRGVERTIIRYARVGIIHFSQLHKMTNFVTTHSFHP